MTIVEQRYNELVPRELHRIADALEKQNKLMEEMASLLRTTVILREGK